MNPKRSRLVLVEHPNTLEILRSALWFSLLLTAFACSIEPPHGNDLIAAWGGPLRPLYVAAAWRVRSWLPARPGSGAQQFQRRIAWLMHGLGLGEIALRALAHVWLSA